MHCDEIRERFVDLLYNERGTPPASAELEAHVRSCPSCRSELEGLRGVRGALGLWREESPLRPVLIPVGRTPKPAAASRFWIVSRRIAAAAAFLFAILALGNTEISWQSGRFFFRTGLFQKTSVPPDSYSRAQTLELVKRAVDDTEARMTETTYLMMQRMLDTLDQERWNDMRLVGLRQSPNRAGN